MQYWVFMPVTIRGLHAVLFSQPSRPVPWKALGRCLSNPIGLADDQLRCKLPERTAGGDGGYRPGPCEAPPAQGERHCGPPGSGD